MSLSASNYSKIKDDEAVYHKVELSKQFTFMNVEVDKVAETTQSSFQQLFIDLACGIAATFLQFVFAISFAAGCFSSQRTLPLFGFGVIMTTLSAVATQAMYSWRSDIPYLFVSPDGFYIPLIIALGDSLSKFIVDDDIFQHTFLFSIVLTTLVVGLAKLICGFYKLVRFSDYIPYPAICGLMAGIGVNLIQVAFRISFIQETQQLSWSIIPAILFTIISIVAQKYKISSSKSFLLLLILSFGFFYASISIFKIPYTLLYQQNWIFKSTFNLNYYWIYSIHELTYFHKVNFQGIRLIFDQILSIAILMVLKISLTIPAYEKALQCRFDKSKELLRYGQGTIFASFFGAVGTSPSLSILTLVTEMGGDGRVPGIIAPILLLFIYFTKFTCISFIPKFIYAGLLLTSGYSMVVTWLISPLYRIPPAESIILIMIILFYLNNGMLFAMGIGSVLSIILFSYRFHQIGCIKFISSGVIFHSREERSDTITRSLRPYRHLIQLVQLQGFIGFSNANQLLDVVIQLLDVTDEDFAVDEDEDHHDITIERSSTDSSRMFSKSADVMEDVDELSIYHQQHPAATIDGKDQQEQSMVENKQKKSPSPSTSSSLASRRLQRRESMRAIIRENSLISVTKAALQTQEEVDKLIIGPKLGSRRAASERIRSLSSPVKYSVDPASRMHKSGSGGGGGGRKEGVGMSSGKDVRRNTLLYSIPDTSSDGDTSDMEISRSQSTNQTSSPQPRPHHHHTHSHHGHHHHHHHLHRPFALILHMNDVVGCDASAMDTFLHLARLTHLKHCRLFLAAVGDNEMLLFTKSGLLNQKHVFLMETLDDALRQAENGLIRHHHLDLSQNTSVSSTTTSQLTYVAHPRDGPVFSLRHSSLKENNNNFMNCLHLIKERYPNIDVYKLQSFEKYANRVDFVAGQKIISKTTQSVKGSPRSHSNSNSHSNSPRGMPRKAAAAAGVATSGSSEYLSSNNSEEAMMTAGMFFLETGTIQHMLSVDDASDEDGDFDDEAEPPHDDVKHYQTRSSPTSSSHDSDSNRWSSAAVRGSSSPLTLHDLELSPHPESASWGTKHGPGWVFEDCIATLHTDMSRELSRYYADTNCTLYYIAPEFVKKVTKENPNVVVVLLQLQLAVSRHQLATASEQLSNLSDVLHFRRSPNTLL